MVGTVTERVNRYIHNGVDQDLRRLLSIFQLSVELARAAFDWVNVREGWRAIECGCSHIGALAVSADLVGDAGRMVGVDFGESIVAPTSPYRCGPCQRSIAVTGSVNEICSPVYQRSGDDPHLSKTRTWG